MKSFVVLCMVVVAINAHSVHLPENQKEKATEIGNQCVTESGVKPEVLAEAKKGHFSDDENLKKFIYCFFHKADIVDSNGKLNIEVALAKLPSGVDKAEAEKLLKSCMNKSGKDAIEKTYEIFKCYHADIKTHVLF